MRKSILTIAIAFSVLSAVFTSCKKDKDEDTGSGQTEASYNLTMDGQTIASGSTIEVGWVGNAATVSKGEEFSVIVSSIPVTVGEVFQFDASSANGSVTIMGKNILLTDGSDEMYFSHAGKVTRESSTKISFEGTCMDILSTESYTFSGTIEADIFQQTYTP